jgi:hypothetical protein
MRIQPDQDPDPDPQLFHRDETWRAECWQTMVAAPLLSTKPNTGRALEALD